MKITEKKSKGLVREYQVVVPAKDIESAVDAKLAEVAKKVKLQGFRPGKAPKNIVKQKYQASVMGEVIDDTVRTATENLIKENELRPAMMPNVAIDSFDEGKDLKVSVKMEVLPTIEVADLSKIKLEKLVAKVDDEEINKALEYMAASRKETKAIETKRAAKNGDVVVMDFVGSIDGVEFQGGAAKGHELELGSNSFIPGFEDQLVGVKAGEAKDVTVSFPKEYHAADLAGKEAVFACTVHEIKEVVKTEINDEFAVSMGSKDLNELKNSISGRISADYEAAAKNKIKKSLFDALDEAHKFEIPESLVEAEFKQIMGQYEQAKEAGQLGEDEAKKSAKDVEKEYKELSERRVRLGLLLSELGVQNKVQINAEDVNKAIMNEARRFPGQEKMVLDYYMKNKEAIEQLKAPLFEEKVVDVVLEKVTLEEKEVSVEELFAPEGEVVAKKPAKKAAAKKTTKKAATKKTAAKKSTAKKAKAEEK